MGEGIGCDAEEIAPFFEVVNIRFADEGAADG